MLVEIVDGESLNQQKEIELKEDLRLAEEKISKFNSHFGNHQSVYRNIHHRLQVLKRFLLVLSYLEKNMIPVMHYHAWKRKGMLKKLRKSTSLPPIPKIFFLETFYISTKLRKKF